MAARVPRNDPGKPVARLVSPIIWRMAALVVTAVVVCVTGVLVTEAAFSRVTDEVQPAAEAQSAFADRVSDVEAAAASYALSEPSARKRYVTAKDALDDAADDLRARGSVGADVVLAIQGEIAAAEDWIATYGDPVVNGPVAVPDPALRTAGQQAMQRYRVARDEARAELARQHADAESDATLLLRLTIILSILLLVGSVVMISRSRQQLLTELSEPLLALEQVVQRMLKNDPEGRAVAHRGPKEVRSIARALNDFADAGSRARAVEGRIQDELHVLDSAKDDFVSNVSHELRTPLTTISGYLEMVADEFEGRLEPRHDRMLEATRRNVVRLRALIDDLLALSKAENRPSELEPSDVIEMVTDAVTDVRMTAARRGITVEVTAVDEPLLVVCDRAMLYRAFLNVLSNAVKFSHDSGSVEVSVTRTGNRVEVSVSDHGIGIPRAELDRLGTRFFRASNAMTNEIAGTGLGLRIVQTIIDKHAGDVVIESTEGEGTTVYVRLRLHGERAGRLPRTMEPLPASPDQEHQPAEL